MVIFPLVWYCFGGLKKRRLFSAQKGSKHRSKRRPPKVPNQPENYYTEMFKLQRSFSAMGTTSGILGNLSPTRVATRSVKSRFLNVGIPAGLSHSSAKHHPLILQFHEVQRFELFMLQELQLVWHCRWMHWPSGTAKLGSALIRAR